MQVLANVLGWVLQKIVGFFGKLTELVVAIFTALGHLARDIVCWAFDGFLGLGVGILNTFDFSALSNQLGAWSSLPAGMIEVLQAVGVSTALGLVVTAIGIRLVLQLIPFTRLGS